MYKDGALREQVMARTVQRELDRDPQREGLAVLIRLYKITTPDGQVVQER